MSEKKKKKGGAQGQPRESWRSRIARELEAEIRQKYRAGAQLPPESKLAERFGVSTLTLREALAHLAERGLVRREQGRGSFVEDPRASQHLGILNDLDLSSSLCLSFWLPLTQHLRHYFDGLGYPVHLYMGYIKPGQSLAGRQLSDEFKRDVDAHRLMGLVVMAGTSLDGCGDKLRKENVPIIGSRESEIKVMIDYRDMYGRAVEKLHQDGCQRIAVLNWGLSQDAVAEVFDAQGVPFDADLCYNCQQLHRLGAGYQEFLDLWDGATEKPDGLFVADEVLFSNVATAILERNIDVPGQLRLCTHMNDGSRVFSPLPRAEIRVSPEDAAHMVGGLLDRQIRGEQVEPGIRYQPLRVVECAGSARTASYYNRSPRRP